MKIFLTSILTFVLLSFIQAQNVGIDNDTPLMKLHVTQEGSNVLLLENSQSLNSNISNGIYFKTGEGGFPYTGAIKSIGQSANEARLGFFTYAAANAEDLLERMSITDAGNVGVGTTTPITSAALDVTSTEKGFLPPRMTTIQRNNIVSPVAGLTIFNSSVNAFQCYNGTNWYSTVHYVGENYGGGIVFYVYDNGQHGLIASTADQSADIRWHGGSVVVTRAQANGINGGIKNTAIIIANQASIDGEPFASTLCNEYTATQDGVTYGDWYLPSRLELELLYAQKNVVGGFFTDNYWSSTETNQFFAYQMHFNTGSVTPNQKSLLNRVRAIRSF